MFNIFIIFNVYFDFRINDQDIEPISFGASTYFQPHYKTCMNSIYNSVEYSIQYLDTHYYFIVLYFDPFKSTSKRIYSNNLNTYEYIPVECSYHVFGVWIFLHGNFVIHSRNFNDNFVYSSDENTSIIYNEDNIILNFDYINYSSTVGYKKLSNYFNIRNLHVMSMDVGTCIQSIYNQAQHFENINNCMNDEYLCDKNKYVIILNLNHNSTGYAVYWYKNNLIDYYYKSVECGGTIFGVWIFSCGQFTIKSNQIIYNENSCNLNQKDVQNYVMDFNGGLIYTLNENTNTYIDQSSTIIINFINGNCSNTYMNLDYYNNGYCR